MTFNDAEFKACPKCGVEPKVEDVHERSLDRPNVMSVTCPLLRDVQQNRVGELDGDAAKKRGCLHACGQLEQPVIRTAVELYRATAWRTVPDLVSGPARRALVHDHADAPHVTAAQIGETERRARTLQRDRARALKRSRKAKR